jgi:hypothetical protein
MEPEYGNGARGTEFPWNSTPSGLNARMAASDPKRTFWARLRNVCSFPEGDMEVAAAILCDLSLRLV